MINKGQIRKNKKFRIGGLTSDNRAFTLIELLVVISIIALLSTIVLGAIGDAREKAEVKKKNEIARQYINAFQLYSTDNGGSYPTTTGYECLGYSAGEYCFATFLDGNENLNSVIEPYYTSIPKNDDYLTYFSTFIAKGIMYNCSSDCFLRWYLPSGEECIYGEATTSGSNYEICDYDFLE